MGLGLAAEDQVGGGPSRAAAAASSSTPVSRRKKGASKEGGARLQLAGASNSFQYGRGGVGSTCLG